LALDKPADFYDKIGVFSVPFRKYERASVETKETIHPRIDFQCRFNLIPMRTHLHISAIKSDWVKLCLSTIIASFQAGSSFGINTKLKSQLKLK